MIAIVDFGLGNIKAFANIYKRLDIPCYFADTADKLKQAEKIILPGVGAFDYAMTRLNDSGMRETLNQLVMSEGIPLLGVCVGMQIMGNSSEEGELEGLGWIPGKVKKITLAGEAQAEALPLPHMGWNNILIEKNDPLFAGLETDPRFYFLHSYYFDCANEDSSIASTEYGFKFSCIVKSGNMTGVQCHPEKSHGNGVMILKNFALI